MTSAGDAGDVTARLIVHGDDFGLSEGVNRAIVAAHENGILTSASIIACGEAFEHAAALARKLPSLDVGVHLTLTEQRPISAPDEVPSLVDARGAFAPHIGRFVARYAAGRVALADVRAELAAQIARAQAAGLAISHLDGHQHVHVLPGIARVVAELARAHGISAVRYPAERVRGYMLRGLRGSKRLAAQLALASCAAASPLRAFRRTDDFVGFHFGGRLTERNLMTVLANLQPNRTTELMCHPGHDDPSGRYGHWGYAWAAELDALVSARVRDFLAARGVRLISFRDA